jgi:hypothetical protein
LWESDEAEISYQELHNLGAAKIKDAANDPEGWHLSLLCFAETLRRYATTNKPRG